MKHEESELQKACVRWFRYQHPNIKIIASLNGIKLSGKTKLERIKQWNHLKAMGAEPGETDTFIAKPNKKYHGLYMEFKIGNEKQSEKQIEFEKYCIENGYQYSISRTVDQFIEIVTNYFKC